MVTALPTDDYIYHSAGHDTTEALSLETSRLLSRVTGKSDWTDSRATPQERYDLVNFMSSERVHPPISLDPPTVVCTRRGEFD